MDIFPAWKRSQIMSRIRSVDTKAEVRLRKALFACGVRYRNNVRGLPGSPDIVMRKNKYAIQVRGCFWHAHEGCSRASRPSFNVDYWAPKLARNKVRDAANDAALAELGWKVRVVWECKIASADALRTMVQSIVQELNYQ